MEKIGDRKDEPKRKKHVDSNDEITDNSTKRVLTSQEERLPWSRNQHRFQKACPENGKEHRPTNTDLEKKGNDYDPRGGSAIIQIKPVLHGRRRETEMPRLKMKKIGMVLA